METFLAKYGVDHEPDITRELKPVIPSPTAKFDVRTEKLNAKSGVFYFSEGKKEMWIRNIRINASSENIKFVALRKNETNFEVLVPGLGTSFNCCESNPILENVNRLSLVYQFLEEDESASVSFETAEVLSYTDYNWITWKSRAFCSTIPKSFRRVSDDESCPVTNSGPLVDGEHFGFFSPNSCNGRRICRFELYAPERSALKASVIEPVEGLVFEEGVSKIKGQKMFFVDFGEKTVRAPDKFRIMYRSKETNDTVRFITYVKDYIYYSVCGPIPVECAVQSFNDELNSVNFEKMLK